MKRLSWLFIVVFVVVVGWYFLWLKTLEKVEFFIAENIEHLQQSNPQVDIDVHYTLKPKGFPFKAGYVVDNIGLISYEKETLHRARVNTKGYNFVYVSIFDFYKPYMGQPIEFYTKIEDFEGQIDIDAQDEKVQVRFNVARSIGQGTWGEFREYTGTLSDLDIYISFDDVRDQRILTVNQFKTKTENIEKNELLNTSTQSEITGATFYDFDGENSFEVDHFSFGFDIANVPLLKDNFLSSLQNTKALQDDLAARQRLKQDTLDYLQSMQASAFEMRLIDFRVTIGEFIGSLDFNFRLNDDLKPVGQAMLNLYNIDALKNIEGLNESSLNLPQFSKNPQENLEMVIESDGKRVFLNGFPILGFIPSADFLLDTFLHVNQLVPEEKEIHKKNPSVLAVDKTKELALVEKPLMVDVSPAVIKQDVNIDGEITIETDLGTIEEISQTTSIVLDASASNVLTKTVSESMPNKTVENISETIRLEGIGLEESSDEISTVIPPVSSTVEVSGSLFVNP